MGRAALVMLVLLTVATMGPPGGIAPARADVLGPDAAGDDASDAVSGGPEAGAEGGGAAGGGDAGAPGDAAEGLQPGECPGETCAGDCVTGCAARPADAAGGGVARAGLLVALGALLFGLRRRRTRSR